MLKRNWPALCAISALLLTTIVLVEISRQRNQGQFVYALDDPYIHMAMARNFAQHGVWGINRHEFSSSTSSPLWTLLLSAFYLVSDSVYWPLLLNLISACGLLLVADRIGCQFKLGPWGRLLQLFALFLFTPLVPLVMVGMEHTLQALLAILFVFNAATLLADKPNTQRQPQFILLLVYSFLMPLVRYELLAFVMVAVVIFITRKRFVRAGVLAATAAMPVILYAGISQRYGALWLPNSVLLKIATPAGGLIAFLGRALDKSISAPHLPLLLLTAGLLYVWRRGDRQQSGDRGQLLLLLLSAAIVLQLFLGDVGWFFRYEAYLVALATVVSGSLAGELCRERAESFPALRNLILVLAGATAVWLSVRGLNAILITPAATTNIYQQQVQMAAFVRTYYSEGPIAANDIGALSYAGNARLLDLWGLGSAEVTRAKLTGNYSTATMADLAAEHGTEIALLYSSWFEKEGGIPSHWQRAGEWTIPNCVVCGNPTVTFYALQPETLAGLRRNLREFAPRLPPGVTYRDLP